MRYPKILTKENGPSGIQSRKSRPLRLLAHDIKVLVLWTVLLNKLLALEDR